MTMETIALFFLVSVAVGGLFWVFIYPSLSGERKAEQRKAVLAQPLASARASAARETQRVRRATVEDTLKELEARHKKRAFIPLGDRIVQAGLDINERTLILIMASAGIGVFLLLLMTGAGFLIAGAMGFTLSFGVPLWFLGFLKKRRESKFIEHFPDAVDTIVRGIKAGLPLLDSMKVIAAESPEPIKGEFRAILETQTVGIPLGDACGKLYERVPLPEANFFAIVVSIQQKSGGNLSEALGNLSKVLRDRKKMRGKIQAMSMEAKASAMIIASLPICVMILVYLTSPGYISLLWTEPLGRVMLFACVCWMSMGVLVMRKMINFDF